MAYDFWLACLTWVGNEKKRRACEIAGGSKALYDMSEAQLRALHLFTQKELDAIRASRSSFRPEEAWASFQKTGMHFAACGDEEYPRRLSEIYNAPFALFYKGHLPKEEKKSVAVVGARNCSEYGRSVAQLLGRTLAQHGVNVISGMAVGIDSASHAGALSAGGETFAVLGSGCDVCYPKSSRSIYENILSGNGGVISELLPGTQPKPMFFPMRNRMISGLADILIVVEARERSGSLITADLALEQGKDVYAVPGRYLDSLSAGCNRLIEQGAGIFVDMDSFLFNAGIVTGAASAMSKRRQDPMDEREEQVYDCLDLTAKYIDEIVRESGQDLLSVLNALDRLKRRDLAQETFQNYFCRKI